jgi:FtsP/CotA-like multicopper oxidase with cupredoxin domain
LSLHAVSGPDGHDAFSFAGNRTPPVIRVSPGDEIKIDYFNDFPPARAISCTHDPCATGMTNLHFHGLSISPRAPQDDVLSMAAMPGEALHYSVHIPESHPPGLYWYHTHPHGESAQQVRDGMSGAIVIEGIDQYVPEVRRLRERILILRAQDIEHSARAAALRGRVEAEAVCGGEHEPQGRIFSVNGSIRPAIGIAPGERQFWRIVNASADQYADVQVDGSSWEIVALDGLPLAYHHPDQPVVRAEHVLLPPAGRLEAIVSGPPAGTPAALRTRCVDTGPDGDPNAGMVLADLVPVAEPFSLPPPLPSGGTSPAHKIVAVAGLEQSAPQFTVIFSEDKNNFYINNQKYSADAKEMVRVRVGTYQHWRIVNESREIHPMHIHQVHFLAYSVNGIPVRDPEWLDTANIPVGGFVDVIMDFTDPVIQGMSVFHCHLLNHEDKGMMAKILFESEHNSGKQRSEPAKAAATNSSLH